MSTAPAVAIRRNPFPGLRPFHEDEEHLFFGRESQVDAMVDKLAATHFLAVVGTSGSGKSSLVNCGLRPALHRGLMARAGTSWRMAQFRPGNDPLRAMTHALAEDGVLFRDYQAGGMTLAEIVDTTLRMSTLGLIDICKQAQLDEGVNLLVVVDQFEELFRYAQTGAGRSEQESGVSDEASAFVNLLLAAGEQRTHPIHVVLTMRSDFLGDCTQFPGLPEAINVGQYLVPRLTRDERRAAITGPVAMGEAEISPVLLTRLVNDVGDNPDQLSILQHALNRTWAHWEIEGGGAGPLDLAHYEAVGTMAHALDWHAEKAFAELGSPRRQLVCEKMFTALTDKATDPRGIRRPTPLGTLCAVANATEAEVTEVIDVFRKPSRSFVMPPAGSALRPETMIDISHESLMRVWGRLDQLADEEALAAGRFRRLANTAFLHSVGAASLWRDPDLQLALEWCDDHQPNEAWASRYHTGYVRAMNFLEASRAARDAEWAEREAQRQREIEAQKEKARAQATHARRMRRAAVFSGALAVIAVAFGLMALVTRNDAVRARRAAQAQTLIANAGRLANASLLSRQDQPDVASLLAIEARNAADVSGTRRALLLALQAHPRLDVLLRHKASVYTVAFDSAGALATGDADGTIRLWRIGKAGATPLGDPFIAHEGPVSTIAFGPNGVLASGGGDGRVRLWRLGDAGATALGESRPGHDGQVLTVAFAPNGTLASGGADGVVRLWTVGEAGAAPRAELRTDHGAVRTVAFGPDGTLASGGADGKVRLWTPEEAGATALGPALAGNGGQVFTVAFGPNGVLASGDLDGTVRLWKLGTDGAASLGSLTDHDDTVRTVTFGPDGMLASGDAGGVVRLWEVDVTGATALGDPLTGHGGPVWTVAFAPDGSLVSGGDDRTVRLWRRGEGSATSFGNPLTGHDGQVLSVAFGRGDLLASGGDDGIVRLWTIGTDGAESRGELVGHDDEVRAVAFGPTGTLASASADGTVRLWTSVGPRATLFGDPLTDHGAAVWTVAFGPDGTLVSGGDDGTVRLWRLGATTATSFGGPLAGHDGPVLSVAFGSEGIFASGGDDGTIRLWRLGESGALPFGDPLEDHDEAVCAVSFSRDGRVLASASSDRTVRLWRLDNAGAAPFGDPLTDHDDPVLTVAFGPDGTLASGGADGMVRLWTVGAAGAVPLGDPWAGRDGQVSTVAFSEQGLLAAGSWTVRLRHTRIDLWRAAACRRASRNFSLTEWQQYMGLDEPYRCTCLVFEPGTDASVRP